jgi:hypothetical protein
MVVHSAGRDKKPVIGFLPANDDAMVAPGGD